MRGPLLIVLISCSVVAFAQQGQGFKAHYHPLRSHSVLSDKLFYLLTVLNHYPSVAGILKKDSALEGCTVIRAARCSLDDRDSISNLLPLIEALKYTSTDSLTVDKALSVLYDQHPATFDHIINKDLRPSGYYQLWADSSNRSLFLKAWGGVLATTNYIIDEYGLGIKNRYSKLDSPSINCHSPEFDFLARGILVGLNSKPRLFYWQAHRAAIQFMSINGRNEPARHEPLRKTINKAAVKKISQTDWSKCPYSAILILGSGPDSIGVPISATCRRRCDSAVLRFKAGKAPFIITSGGYVSPYRTKFCEALEMKRYLMDQCGIPADAIIVDPYARHTTTNIRNANRLIFKYKIPDTMQVLVISSPSHISTIAGPGQQFDARNLMELGYLPYLGMRQISQSEATYSPCKLSMHTDSFGPLDP